MTITDLEPKQVWERFYDVTRVPRPSKREAKMVAFLEKFAQQHNLQYKKDHVGNIVMFKPATKGLENRKPIVLQSHMDMVCEKNASTNHDFDNDPIETYIDGEWLKAKGTTLGADDGMGVAAELAIMIDNTIKHGPIECLFTVDEETGLTGAMEMKSGFFTGKTLLNLDSEDEGQIFIGCAGGCSTLATFRIDEEDVPAGSFGLKVVVNGLQGGHSGGDIHLGRGNANKLIARFAMLAADKCSLRISDVHGGNLHNAIAREAELTGVVPFAQKENVRVLLNEFAAEIEAELKAIDPGVRFSMESVEIPSKVYTADLQRRLISSIVACPHGVLEMSHEIDNLVETSTNLASVKVVDGAICIGTSQRSSVNSAKVYAQQMVASAFTLAGADVTCGEGYPGWTPDTSSPILRLASQSYKRLFGKEPMVLAIHAGLECGLFLEKYPGLDMISFGPTLRGVHSPDEKIEIKTVQMFWDHLIDIIEHFDE